MSAPFLTRGEQRYSSSSSSSATSTAVRDALCHRIRVLGASILVIAQSAIAEAESLDDVYAEQQRLLANNKPPREWSLRTGKAGTKASRPSKTGSAPTARAAVQPQRRARPPFSAEVGSGAPTLKQAVSPRLSPLALGGSPSHPQSGGSAKKRQQRSKQSPTPVRVGETGAAVGAAAASASQGAESLSKRFAKPALQADVAVMELCAAAEANFQRVFAQRVPQDRQSPRSVFTSGAGNNCEKGRRPCVPYNWCRGAPLYDLSNAAVTSQYSRSVSATEAFPDGEDNAMVPCNTSPSILKTEDGGLTSRVITASGAAPLSTRAFVAASELSHEAEQQALYALNILPHQRTGIVDTGVSKKAQLPAEANECTPQQRERSSPSSLSPTRSYYRVVYIHQLRHMRAVPSSGGGGGADFGLARRQGRDLACTLPYWPIPRVLGLGSAIPSAAAEEAGETPLRVASYVQAVYAVDRVEALLSDPPADGDSEAASRMMAASMPVSGDTELVQLELRLPAHCTRGNGDPSLNAAPPIPTGADPSAVTNSSSFATSRQPDAGTDAASSSSVSEATENRNATNTQSRKVAQVSALGAAADAQIAARIESIKDWQRDRHADVEDRIRRQRRSPIVSAGWKGEYYFYTNSEDATTVGDGAGMPTAYPASSTMHAHSVTATAAPGDTADCATTIEVSYEPRDTSYEQQTPQHQDPQALSSFAAVARSSSPGKATTYAVLLPASQQPAPSLRSSNEERTGPAAALLYDSDNDRVQTHQPAQPSQKGPVRSAVTAATAAAAATGDNGRGAAAATRSTLFPKSRLSPWMEVVVASSYSSIEWAFGGAVRRASAAEPNSAGSESPLWTAHRMLEREWEEQRRWNARTRQPHGLDIHSPIYIQIVSRVS